MSTRKITMMIEGQPQGYAHHNVVMEVPECMTNEEAECVNADHFRHVQSGWEIEESEEVCPQGFPDFVGVAEPNAQPDVIVIKDENGEYRVSMGE